MAHGGLCKIAPGHLLKRVNCRTLFVPGFLEQTILQEVLIAQAEREHPSKIASTYVEVNPSTGTSKLRRFKLADYVAEPTGMEEYIQ